MSDGQLSILALTEYINTEDNSWDNDLQNDKKFPILSHPSVKRVGLAVPYFIKDNFTILDPWFLEQTGRTTTRSDGKKVAMKSNKIAQICNFKYSYKSAFFLSVVYIAPDINDVRRQEVFDKIREYNFKFKNYIAVGDINFDQRIILNKFDLEEAFQDHMHQIVDKVTRQKTIQRKDKTTGVVKESTSSTTIDLVFVQNNFLSKVKNLKILKNMPSDHHLVHFDLDFQIPDKYTTREIWRDPRRRPKLREIDIPKAKEMLSHEIQDYSTGWKDINQSECFEKIEMATRKVLDKFCPLNQDKPSTVKVWRDRFSKEFRVAKNRRMARLNELRKAALMRQRNPTSDYFLRKLMAKQRKFREENKRYRAVFRKELGIKNQEEEEEVKNDPNAIWKYINSCDPIEKNNASSKMVIDGKEQIEAADHMNEYLYKRAHLVHDDVVEEYKEHIPIAEFDYCEPAPIEEVFLNEKPVRELYFPPGTVPSLACGPDTISHKHIYDLFDVLEGPLQYAMDKPVDNFHNVQLNYSRLIKKDPSSKKANLTEKDVRPIGETNILTKYGPVRAFIDRLRKLVLPNISPTQYSMPGKGCPVAIFDLLDDVNYFACLKKPMLLAIWDFSNAFCTFSHEVMRKIYESFKIPKKDIDLCMKFLDQSGTQVKMEDACGHYISKVIVTRTTMGPSYM